ncbi:MAG: hypothetical protein JWM58_1891 [Rhizobium sp.]|nr:hypothetical protein [Rhizobium sp.]
MSQSGAGILLYPLTDAALGSGITSLAMEHADLPGHPVSAIAMRGKAALESWWADLLDKAGIPSPSQRAQELALLVDGATALVLIHSNRSYADAAAAAAKRLLGGHAPSASSRSRPRSARRNDEWRASEMTANGMGRLLPPEMVDCAGHHRPTWRSSYGYDCRAYLSRFDWHRHWQGCLPSPWEGDDAQELDGSGIGEFVCDFRNSLVNCSSPDRTN